MDIRGIVFDVDDTLYDMSQPFFYAYQMLWTEEYDLPLQDLFLAFRGFSDEKFSDVQAGKMRLEDVYIYRFRMMMRTYGIETTDADALAFQEVYMGAQYRIQLSQVMKDLLGNLRNHVSIGIITNGDSVHQRKKIRALDVSPWIPDSHIIVSGDYSFCKPNVRIFREMEQRLQMSPKELLYIGDAFDLDIAGAYGAGWHSVWFNHRRRTHPDVVCVAPDIEAHSEEDLFTAVRQFIEK